MSTDPISQDREQVERVATHARLTLQAVRDALAKAELTDKVEPVLSHVATDTVYLRTTDPEYLGIPAVAIQNIDVPTGFLEAENDFTVRFIPYD